MLGVRVLASVGCPEEGVGGGVVVGAGSCSELSCHGVSNSRPVDWYQERRVAMVSATLRTPAPRASG